MTPEKEKQVNIQSFIRLEKLFRETPIENSRSEVRNIKLDDGTKIRIGAGRSFPSLDPLNYYDVRIEPLNDGRENILGKPDSQGFSFEIDEKNICLIRGLPDIEIKIGDIELVPVEIPTLHVKDIRRSKDGTIIPGRILLDWLDKIIKDNKYSHPPISASIFR